MILNGLLLFPATVGYTVPIAAAALLVALLILVFSLTGKRVSAPAQPVEIAAPSPVPVPIQPPTPAANQAQAEIVAFFGLLQ